MRFLAVPAFLLFLLAACGPRPVWTVPVKEPDPAVLAGIAPEGRLPATAYPLAYRVALDIDPRRTDFSGRVEIDIGLRNAANGIWLHGLGLDVLSVTARAGGETLEAEWYQVSDTGVAWVGFPRRLEASRLTLAIDYQAAFDTGLAGLFRVQSQGQWYALAKSESIQARRFLPGFDEPGFKAVFDVALTIPEGMQAIANTPETARAPAGEGFQTLYFAPTRPLSTYLLSVAVGGFEKVVREDLPPGPYREAPVPLAGFARPGKAGELAFALDLTPQMVAIFEDMLAQPYPYDKLDLVAAPQWPSGATELAGAITYREGRLLVGPNAGPGLKRSVSEIHAHEIAHMWFGNLVTPPWWDDLWLKEAFATWSETAVLSLMEPGAGHELTAISDGLRAMALDSLDGARAVAEPVARNADVRSAYDAITYSKGQAVIRMIDTYFGPETLRPALGRYIADHADGEADSDDFYRSVSKASGEPAIGEVFRSFVTRPGVPLVSVETVCGRGSAKLRLSQSRYRPIGSALSSGEGEWTIPVCSVWKDGANQGRACTLLDREAKTIDLPGTVCPQWVVANAGGAGYYRFDPGPESWQALTGDLPALEASEALVSLDSAWAGVLSGRLPAGIYLDLLGAGLRHEEPSVLMAALAAWEEIFRRLDGGDGALRERAAGQLAGVSAGPGDEAEMRLTAFRARFLADEGLRAGLRAQLDAFLNGRAGLPTDLYLTALRIDVEDGGRPAFERARQLILTEDDALLKQAAADAIGAAPETWQGDEIIDLIRAGAVSQQVTYSVLAGLMQNPRQREHVWAIIAADLPGLAVHLPAQTRRAMARLAGPLCDASRASELSGLFAGGERILAGHERALAETRQSLIQCEAQRDHLEAALAALAD